MDERDRPWGTLVDFSNTTTTVEQRSTVRDVFVGAGASDLLGYLGLD